MLTEAISYFGVHSKYLNLTVDSVYVWCELLNGIQSKILWLNNYPLKNYMIKYFTFVKKKNAL